MSIDMGDVSLGEGCWIWSEHSVQLEGQGQVFYALGLISPYQETGPIIIDCHCTATSLGCSDFMVDGPHRSG
jgi:hypothetical protein